ncbi:hypothetical protein, partial [Micropruina sp.]|uniref:hypothetical protein n=1 Tax=Micropruina sp. TaxID=2737536 RepID=UPI0039E3AAEF
MSSWQTPQTPRPEDRAWTPTPTTTSGPTPAGPMPGGHVPGNVFGAPPAAAPVAPARTPRRSRAAMFFASTALAAVVGAGAGVGGY